jgi:Flp pilus assembly protein TadG
MLRTHSLRYHDHPRAAVFVWFLTVSVPLLLLGSMFAIDFSTILIARNEVQLAAESAALAGASEAQIETQTQAVGTISYLNAAQAAAIAKETMTAEDGAHSMPHAVINPNGVAVTVVADPFANALNTVTVTVTYTVPNLIFLDYFGYKSPTITDSSIAFLCVPGQTGQTYNQSGVCTTPTR